MNEKQLKEIIESYSKLSNDELMAEFAKHMAAQNKKDGGESMRRTVERIKPFLNAQQQKRLEQVLQDAGAAD